MAILERGNENWTALEALIDRVGTSNVLYAIAAITRDRIVKADGSISQLHVNLGPIIEKAANDSAKYCPHRCAQRA